MCFLLFNNYCSSCNVYCIQKEQPNNWYHGSKVQQLILWSKGYRGLMHKIGFTDKSFTCMYAVLAPVHKEIGKLGKPGL